VTVNEHGIVKLLLFIAFVAIGIIIAAAFRDHDEPQIDPSRQEFAPATVRMLRENSYLMRGHDYVVRRGSDLR